MKINKIDHIGIVVNDLSAAKEFFFDFGFELLGEGPVEGEWVDRVIGLKDVKAEIVMVQAPNGQLNLELTKFHTPRDTKSIQHLPANALGIRHIAFVVDNIESVVAKLKRKGIETVGEIQNYENTYKLCYVRGPEGIIVEFAEEIK